MTTPESTIYLEAQGHVPPGDSFGARFVASSHYRLAAKNLDYGDFRIRLASGEDVAAFLADAGDTVRREVDAPPVSDPVPAVVPSLVETIEVPAGVNVRKIAENLRILDGAAATVGSPLPKARVGFDDSHLTPKPWGPYFEIDGFVFEDASVARPYVDRLVGELFWSFMEADMITGDGTAGGGTYQLPGILTTAGVGETPTSGNLVADLAESCAKIGENGHYGPYAALLHPRTLATALFGDEADQVKDALPLIDRFLPSLFIAEGHALTGDFPRGARLFITEGGLSIDARHQMLEGNWWVRPTAEILFDVHHPGAFDHVTDES